jgi:hypothetical protein
LMVYRGRDVEVAARQLASTPVVPAEQAIMHPLLAGLAPMP